MTDVHSKEIRSYNMSQIRGKDTKPELLVRKFLFSEGFRYKLHDKKLPGKPDIVLPKYKIVVFVNGCFWHAHKKCKYFVVPKTRKNWWLNKINRTKELDKENYQKLRKRGWKVISIFECELKNGNAEKTLEKLIKLIKNENSNN